MNKTILERIKKENYITSYPTKTSGYLLKDGSYVHLVAKVDEDCGACYRNDHRSISHFMNSMKKDDGSGNDTMERFMKKYDFVEPVLFSIVLGHEGEAPATPQALATMIQMIPSNARWGITHANRRDFSIIAAAAGMGAKTIRIGFEDSDYLDPDTKVSSNLPLVKKTVELLRAMDKMPMTPEEGRAYFQIGK